MEKMASVPNGGGYNIVGTLCARDYKGVSNKSPFDGKVVIEKNNAETKTIVDDVVSWKERDRLAQPRVNITDPVAASDYKGPSFVGYMEKDNEALCVQMANTSSNGSNINHDVSATLAKNNTLAVAYKDEHES